MLRIIFKFFPVFLLAFSISQNFTVNSLLRSLVTVPVFIPLFIYLFVKDHPGNLVKGDSSVYKWLVVVASGCLLVYFQWSFSLIVLWSVLSIMLVWGIEKFYPAFSWAIAGMFIFCLNYLNINTFGIDHLLRTNLILPAVFALCYYDSLKNRKILIINGGFLAFMFFNLNRLDFAVAALGLSLVGFLMMGIPRVKRWISFTMGFGFSILFLFYLLYGVHLIQTFE